MIIVKPNTPNNHGGFARASNAKYYDDGGLLVTASNDVLRVGFNPSTLRLIGPIIEPTVDNDCVYSEDFSQSQWVKGGDLTLAASVEVDPEGNTAATRITSSSNDVNNAAMSYTSSNTGEYETFSAFAKAGTVDSIEMLADSPSNFSIATFDLTNGSFSILENGTPDADFDAQIQSLPNGIFRLSISYLPTAAHDCRFRFSTGNVHLFGAQIEIGKFPTSYIPTSGSVATRIEDTLTSNNNYQSDVVLDSIPAFVLGSAYVTLDQVIYTENGVEDIYEALGSVTGELPPESANWLYVGPSNRFTMFTRNVGLEKQTINPSSINVLVNSPTILNGLILFGMNAVSVTVALYDAANEKVYEKNISLVADYDVTDWYLYFYGEVTYISELPFLDMPTVKPSLLTVSIDNLAGSAACSKMIYGLQKRLGTTNHGTSVGIVDYSQKVRDTFGNFSVTERRFSKRTDYDITIETLQIRDIQKTLAQYRATPIGWIGEETALETILYGYYRDFSIVISEPTVSDCSIQVEEI